MRDALLRADERAALFGRVERDVEALMIPGHRRLAKLLHALVRGIAMEAWLRRRLLHRRHDMRRRRQIGIADAEIDQILALRPQRRLLAVDIGKEIGGELANTLRQ